MRVLGLHAPRSCHALAAAGALVGARLRQPRMWLRAAEAQGDTVQRRGRSEKTAAAGRDSGAPGTQADVAAATRSGTVAVAVSWAHRGRCQRLPHRPCKDVPHNRKAETPHTHTHHYARPWKNIPVCEGHQHAQGQRTHDACPCSIIVPEHAEKAGPIVSPGNRVFNTR